MSVPAGYHTVTPYLIVAKAAEAIEFYKRVFGAEEELRLDMPDGRIGHAEIRIGDSKLMLADEFPEMGALGPGATRPPISLLVYVTNVDEVADRGLAAGMKTIGAVKDQFYGDHSGTFQDPFGHLWTIATHIEDVSPEELRRRSAALHGGSTGG